MSHAGHDLCACGHVRMAHEHGRVIQCVVKGCTCSEFRPAAPPKSSTPAPDTKVPLLEDLVAEKVRDWVRRASARMNTETLVAELRIHLLDLGWDDDGTPIVDAKLEEHLELEPITGRVPEAKP